MFTRTTRTWRFVAEFAIGFVCVVLTAPSLNGQTLRNSASTLVRVNVLGSVGVDLRSVPVSFAFTEGEEHSQVFTVPVRVHWNVNPAEVHGVELIGYFRNPDAAVISSRGVALDSQHVEARVGGAPFHSFTETNEVGPASSSLLLANYPISAANRIGAKTEQLDMRLHGDPSMPVEDEVFSGTLQLEVRHY